jgi:hypothetical protein
MRTAKTLPLIAILALGGCSAASPRMEVRKAEPAPEKWTIQIITSPPGGVVDWNGNVLGPGPLKISFHPQTSFGGRPVWPENGSPLQIFRARWPDGCMSQEVFTSRQTLPQVVGIVSPHAHLYRRPANTNSIR